MANGGGERIVTASPTTAAGGRVIASPFQFYVDGNDHLRVEGWNSATGAALLVQGRFLDEQGKIDVFSFTLLLTTDRVRATEDFAMGRGFVLNLVVTVIGAAPRIGQTFARLSVIRGFTGATLVMGVMLQGYVTAQQGLGWPGSPIQATTEIDGYLRSISGTLPAAGAPLLETVPAGAHWSLIAVAIEVTTDGTAVTRRPELSILAPSILYSIPNIGTIGASGALLFYWAAGVSGNIQIVVNFVTTVLAHPTELDAGHQFRIALISGVAGDQFTYILYQVRERLEVA